MLGINPMGGRYFIISNISQHLLANVLKVAKDCRGDLGTDKHSHMPWNINQATPTDGLTAADEGDYCMEHKVGPAWAEGGIGRFLHG